jgi:hypothetical protein
VRSIAATSAVVRETRSPGAGALDGGERQREHAVHEVLAQLGEHLLGEHERGAAREPGQHRLREQERGEDEHGLVDVRSASCLRRRPGRGGRAGPGRETVAAAAA